MIKIALTGSKLSGKNTACEYFKNMGIPVFDADTTLKLVMHYNHNVNYKINRKFGPKAFEIGFISKNFFNTDEKLKQLIKLCEEELIDYYIKFNNKHKDSPYTIFKCSFLFESDLSSYKETRYDLSGGRNKMTNEFIFDSIINIWAPVDIRVLRANSKNVNLMLNKEFDTAIKKKLSTFNIESTAGSNIQKQIDDIDIKLRLKHLENAVNHG